MLYYYIIQMNFQFLVGILFIILKSFHQLHFWSVCVFIAHPIKPAFPNMYRPRIIQIRASTPKPFLSHQHSERTHIEVVVSLFKSHVNKKERRSFKNITCVTKTTEKDLFERMLNAWKHEVNSILILNFYPKNIPAIHLQDQVGL